jgi:hypothetical protein
MSSSDTIEIWIDIGEDFAAQIYWTDSNGNAIPITSPARLEVRDSLGNRVLQFDAANSGSAATKAAILITGSEGLLQLSCPKALTKTLEPGRYLFDLFATNNSGFSPFPTQEVKVADGWVVAQGRTTVMEGALV